MKFSGTIKATKEFKTAISSIQGLIEEATFFISEMGIEFRGVEPSHVRYIEVMFPANRFLKFDLEEETKFTIRSNEFLEVIKRAKNDEEVTIEMEDHNKPLQIYLGGKKHYTLALISTDHETPRPKFPVQSRTRMRFSNFHDYVKDIAVVGDNFIIKTDEQKMKILGKGDAGKVDLEAEIASMDQKEDGELKSEYNGELLVEAMKTFGTAFEDIIIETGHELPLKLILESPDMGTLIYVQAHKQLY